MTGILFGHRLGLGLAAAGTGGGGGPTPLPVPSMSRVAISQVYDSLNDAPTKALLLANAERTYPSVPIAAGTTRTIAWKCAGPITGKGAFIWQMGGTVAIPNADLVCTYAYSTDSTDGANGTWTNITFDRYKPLTDANTSNFSLRGWLARVAAMVGTPWIRCVIQNTGGSSRTLRAMLMQRPADGTPDDLILCTGVSLLARHAAIAILQSGIQSWYAASRDPILINMALSDTTPSEWFTNCVQYGLSVYPEAGHLWIDEGGAPLLTGRPYTPNPTSGAFATAFNNVAALMPTYPMCRVYAGPTNYRDYRADQGGAGLPAVNDLANPENGARPVNVGEYLPKMRANWPYMIDETLGAFQVDSYSNVMADPLIRQDQTDWTHSSAAGIPIYLKNWAASYVYAVTGAWPKGSIVRDLEAYETANTVTAYRKAHLQGCIDQLPTAVDSGQTVARAALTTRLNAIPVAG